MRSFVFVLFSFVACINCFGQSETPSGIRPSVAHAAYPLMSVANDLSAREQHRQNQVESFKMQESVTAAPVIGCDYDVTYYRLQLRINPDTAVNYVKGSMTNHFKTRINNFSVLKYDFAAALVCDSIYYHGLKLASASIVKNVNVLEITLTNTITAAGTFDSITVYYQGVPPLVSGFGGGTGFVKSTHGSFKNYIYTLSEPYSAFTWWPCKSMIANDKADTLEMWISNPAGFRSASNGVRVSETNTPDGVLTFWLHLYPISSYQVCLAVANYVQYPATPDKVNINGTMMDYYNLIFPESNTATSQGQLDKTKAMLTCFTTQFGDYPFKKEKYGNYTFGFGGGMEHNTFSGMNASTYDNTGAWDVNAHELGHQWWGASVTCGSWADIWVNESFATYSEIVCAEFAPSVTSGWTGVAWRQRCKNIAMNPATQTQSTSVSDTSTILTIFTPAVYIYERGGMTISMLRKMLGDTKFFQALKNYQSDPLLRYGNARTSDVRRHMENALGGVNLATFFNNWINNTGFADYNTAKWNSVGKTIIFSLPQTVTSSALTHFDMPIVVRIQGALVANDTTVTIYDQGGAMFYVSNGVFTPSGVGANKIQYNLSFVPTSVTFDPYSETMANGGFTQSAALLLATNILTFNAVKQADGNKLTWTIDKAFDYNSFQVERSSDGSNFSKIATLNANDYAGLSSFHYTDANSYGEKSFYRIKVLEKDGTIIYTKTVVVNNGETEGSFTVSPNPASDYINVTSNFALGLADIRVLNATGREVKKFTKQNFATNNYLRVSVSELVAGNYFVEIRNDSKGVQTKKLVIVR